MQTASATPADHILHRRQTGWKKHRKDIIDHEVKVMRRINNRPVAVEAVLTSS